MKILYDDLYIEMNGSLSDKMTEKAFFNFCASNDLVRLERDEKGQIYIMPLIGMIYSNMNVEVCGEIYIWNKKYKKGVSFGSCVGFTLSDNSVRSPGAAWMKQKTWDAILPEEKEKFARACPEFIYELKSGSDNLIYLKNKMQKWIENGCELAWLIIPEKEEAHIYRNDGSIEIVKGFDKKLSGENVLQGFELDLSILQ